VHPILSDRRWLAAYVAASVPLAAATVAILTRGARAFPIGAAILVSVPFALVALVLLLPVWYVCRTLPVREAPLSRLVATHGVCAASLSLAWTYVGAALVRLVASFYPELGLEALYRLHVADLVAAGAMLYLLSASFHYMLLAVEATRRAEQRSLEMAVLAREAELKALKAQVHPHFLFNSLNSISALTASDPARAREMCVLLSEFFRSSLAMGDRPSVVLDDELSVARNYLAIEGMRLGSRLRVEESIDEAARTCRLPPLLLQPLVENAIRHGIATCAEGGVLRLEARADETTLRLLIENPFDPESPTRPGVGLGLSSVRQRLAACHGERAALQAERLPGRFRVTAELPAQREA
jgi:sensor histidine kinase YesM